MKYRTNSLQKRPYLETDIVTKHLNFLKEKFYQIEAKWPQFKILFESLESLADHLPSDQTILILERAYFYGGWTLFAPIFHNQKVISIDCVMNENDERWGAQESWLKDINCVKWRPDYINKISNMTNVESESIDYVIVPNVIHHEKDQNKMFSEFNRVLKKNGKCLIFEGLVRELHHMPYDYVRYTHEGLKVMLENNGLKFEKCQFGSGVFDVISYVWQNAFEYLPEDLRKEKMEWFYKEHFPHLQEMDAKYKENILKPDKSFPMSYVVWSHKD
jgi:SAM-dependent methyltransferase